MSERMIREIAATLFALIAERPIHSDRGEFAHSGYVWSYPVYNTASRNRNVVAC